MLKLECLLWESEECIISQLFLPPSLHYLLFLVLFYEKPHIILRDLQIATWKESICFAINIFSSLTSLRTFLIYNEWVIYIPTAISSHVLQAQAVLLK